MEPMRRWVGELLGVPVKEKSVGELERTWGTLATSLQAVHAVALDPLAEPAITTRLDIPGPGEGAERKVES